MSIATVLHTPRLTLVPATVALVEAELTGAEAFAALLEAAVPASWPPGEYSREAQEFFLECLRRFGAKVVGWFGWYAVRIADAEAPATVVSACGYLGPPKDGVAEIGYSVCPEWRGRGYARELAATLAAHAARQPGVSRVIAHTKPTNSASIRVLEASGFILEGAGTEPDTLRFRYER